MAFLTDQSKPGAVIIEQALAWRAALTGWLWGALTIIGGLFFGVVSDQSELAFSNPLFWAWLIAMGVLFKFVWARLHEASEVGMLNFTIARLGWLLVGTVLWTALTAGPAGAYAELFKSLTNLQTQPEGTQVQVMGSLMLGQGFLLFAAIAWITLVVSLFIPKLRGHPQVGAALMSMMLLFCGLALGMGAHAAGQLISMAPRI